MRRLTVTMVTGAIIGTMVTAVGCGGSPQPFHPKGSVAPTQQATGAGGSLPPGVVRYPFPADVHFEFQTPLPADPQQRAVEVADDDYFVASAYYVLTDGRDRSFTQYAGNNAMVSAREADLAQFATQYSAIRGTERTYRYSVGPDPDISGEMEVTFCDDRSRLFDIRKGTGKADPDMPSDEQIALIDDTLARGAGGRWLVTGSKSTFYPQGQARECQP